MKKRFTTFIWLLMAFGIQSQAQDFESATDAVKNMGVGWNLGNTLDANGTGISDVVQSAPSECLSHGMPILMATAMWMLHG